MHGSGRFTKRTMKPQWLLRFLAEEGLDANAMAKVLDLHPDYLVDAQGSMHLDDYLRLFEWAAEEFKRPHLGLELAANYHQKDYGVLIFLASSAATLAEGFRLIERYERTLQQGAVMQSIEHGDAVVVSFPKCS